MPLACRGVLCMGVIFVCVLAMDMICMRTLYECGRMRRNRLGLGVILRRRTRSLV